MKFLIPLALSTAFGFLFLARFLTHSRLKHKVLFMILFSPATGMALVSLLLFCIQILLAPQARFLSAAVPLACIVLLCLRIPRFKKPVENCAPQESAFTKIKHLLQPAGTPAIQNILGWLLAGLLFYTACHFWTYLTGYMSWNAFGGWDTRAFWTLKAHFLHRDPEQWQLLFSKQASWANSDYPLMIPGITAWGWNLLGREMLIWPMVIAAVFIFSLAGLLLWYLACWRSWATALAACLFFLTTYAYRFWAGAMYCDIPLAFFETMAVLLWISGLRLGEARLFALAGLFAGFAGWTKNEGILFILALTTSTGLWLAILGRQKKTAAGKFFLSFLCGLTIPLTIFLYFKIFLAVNKTLLIQTQTPQATLAALTNWDRIAFILAAFGAFKWRFENWHGLWLLFAAALIYKPLAAKRGGRETAVWLPVLTIFLVETGYLLVFAQTPLNLQFHLQTSMLRLLLHTGALALVFAFETFGLSAETPDT
ncbi:MAG: hypothetical protein A2Y02_03155 [Omnitrophica bacterium GWA2_52_12]|nr:MAG: hypothetical protein A2Y02_03155 [Omnitrophica bacterium GWA2_52_12]